MLPARAVLVAAALAGSTAVVGAASAEAQSPSRPTVVVTTNILGDIVSKVLGGVADVEVLMPANADPHSFSISAAQAAGLEQADLIVVNGLGLEGGVLNNVEAAEDTGATVLELAAQLDPLRYDDVAGHEAGQFDPHVWTDPTRMHLAVDVVVDVALDELPEVDASAVQSAAADYQEQLASMEASMEERFEQVPEQDRLLVTNHHVFGYFAERFGFEIVGAVLPSGTTLASPSASDLDDLAQVLRETGVPAIFADSSQPALLAEALADESGLDVAVVGLFTESLGPPGSGAETYLAMLDTNTDLIVDELTR